MNYIEQLMKDNDIEVGEEFYIFYDKNRLGKVMETPLYFDEKLYLAGNAYGNCYIILRGLMTGEYRIEKIPQKPKSVWDLKEKDEYYYIDIYGGVDITTFGIGTCWEDKKMIEIGNAFLTEKEVRFEVERRKCEAVLLKYGTRDLMSFGDKYTKKYYIQYDYDVNKIMIFKHYSIGIQGVINFKTEELAQKAIDEVGEDRLKKYIFNVKE